MVSYQNSGYFSKIIIDYLNQHQDLKSFYNRFPSLENFKLQLEEKANTYNHDYREVLVQALRNQYQEVAISENTKNNIDALQDKHTFSITTGHQLNIFTGPLYFIYKIVSVINLCKQLQLEYPEHQFVPIYWMATEDHDFAEINHFQYHNTKLQWNNPEASGAVGRLSTQGLDEVYEKFCNEIGSGIHATYLKELFKQAYLEHSNLASATRFLVNELFQNEGLIIVDGDSKELKQLFVPYVKQELMQQISYREVSNTITKLKDNYDIQVNPREINLFYIDNNLRERIVLENDVYKVNNTTIRFTAQELEQELENNPEKFSPNVILRPLYQETILPNLCYIGGGGELAYWLELKSNFDAQGVTFPILLLRNSVVLLTEKMQKKIEKLHLTWNDLFLPSTLLSTQKAKQFSKFNIDFSDQKEHLKKQFNSLQDIAARTDKSFLKALQAQEKKQILGLEHLEKRLLKAEKKVYADKLKRILAIQAILFPKQSLQERVSNFSEYYQNNGSLLFTLLFNHLDPLSQNFSIILLPN